MNNLTAKLVQDNGQQRFYELSHKLTKGILWGKEIDLIEELKTSKDRDFKLEYKHLCPIDGRQMKIYAPLIKCFVNK